MVNHQEYAYPDDHDYDSGSLHLKYLDLRKRIQKTLRVALAQIIDQRGNRLSFQVSDTAQ